MERLETRLNIHTRLPGNSSSIVWPPSRMTGPPAGQFCVAGETVRFRLTLDDTSRVGQLMAMSDSVNWRERFSLVVIPSRGNPQRAVPRSPLEVEYTFRFPGRKRLVFTGEGSQWPLPGTFYNPRLRDLYGRVSMAADFEVLGIPTWTGEALLIGIGEAQGRQQRQERRSRSNDRELASRHERDERGSLPDGVLRFRIRSGPAFRQMTLREALEYTQDLQRMIAATPPLDLLVHGEQSDEVRDDSGIPVALSKQAVVERDRSSQNRVIVYDRAWPSGGSVSFDQVGPNPAQVERHNQHLRRHTLKTYGRDQWIVALVEVDGLVRRALFRGQDLLDYQNAVDLANALNLVGLISDVFSVLVPAVAAVRGVEWAGLRLAAAIFDVIKSRAIAAAVDDPMAAMALDLVSSQMISGAVNAGQRLAATATTRALSGSEELMESLPRTNQPGRRSTSAIRTQRPIEEASIRDIERLRGESFDGIPSRQHPLYGTGDSRGTNPHPDSPHTAPAQSPHLDSSNPRQTTHAEMDERIHPTGRQRARAMTPSVGGESLTVRSGEAVAGALRRTESLVERANISFAQLLPRIRDRLSEPELRTLQLLNVRFQNWLQALANRITPDELALFLHGAQPQRTGVISRLQGRIQELLLPVTPEYRMAIRAAREETARLARQLQSSGSSFGRVRLMHLRDNGRELTDGVIAVVERRRGGGRRLHIFAVFEAKSESNLLDLHRLLGSEEYFNFGQIERSLARLETPSHLRANGVSFEPADVVMGADRGSITRWYIAAPLDVRTQTAFDRLVTSLRTRGRRITLVKTPLRQATLRAVAREIASIAAGN